MKNREYFNAVVKQKELRPKNIKTRIGFFKTEVKVVESYFLKCQIEGTNWLIVIPCEKNIYDNAKICGRLSIHLTFQYDYSCFHFMPTKKEIKEINI